MSSIYHYGVDGQKWGVRHGPPYPLSRQKKSESWKIKNKDKTDRELKRKTRSIGKRDKAQIILENMDDLTLDEIRDLLTRIELEEKITNMASFEKKEGQELAISLLKKAGELAVATTIPFVVRAMLNKASEK